MNCQERSSVYSALLSVFLLMSSSVSAHEKVESNFNIAVQPLRFFAKTLSASVEYKLTSTLTLVVPFRFTVDYTPLWNQYPGWTVSTSSGTDLKIYLTGDALENGFYLQPGLELGWGNRANSYELQIIQFLARKNISAFLVDPTYLYGDSFFHVDLRFLVGYGWFFSNDVNLDLSAGLAITNVFPLGKNSGHFYLLPVPLAEFSVGIRF